ncbi:MAG: histidinol-phosphatase [Capsulimonadales bacterium]|nr:histidinol-phosphatase [Capsulimonadales bacterium]
MSPSEIRFDYHSHHHRCGHASGDISDYIERALSLGMVAFGVSDHGPAYWLPGDHDQPLTQMAKSELPRYVEEGRNLQRHYRDRIAVRVGLEADYIEGREAELATILAAHSFDYVLGSVHYAFGRNIFNPARWTHPVPAVYEEYYRLVAKAAASGLFDILSHLTAVEAYAPPPTDAQAEQFYVPVADAVAASGAVVEINTSGYRKMGGDEPFPNRRMLRLLIERGVPLTFSSDCHSPAEVGFGRERVAGLLRELGIETSEAQPVRRKSRQTPGGSDGRGEVIAFQPTPNQGQPNESGA